MFLFLPFRIWVARISLTRISPAAFEWIVILLIFSSLWMLRSTVREKSKQHHFKRVGFQKDKF